MPVIHNLLRSNTGVPTQIGLSSSISFFCISIKQSPSQYCLSLKCILLNHLMACSLSVVILSSIRFFTFAIVLPKTDLFMSFCFEKIFSNSCLALFLLIGVKVGVCLEPFFLSKRYRPVKFGDIYDEFVYKLQASVINHVFCRVCVDARLACQILNTCRV